jgi:hypothetical protein
MPNNFDRFKEIFLKTDLGKSLSEEELKDRFNKYKNRPYIAVSFLNNKDDIKILMLKRGTRNIKTAIESAIEAKNAIIKSNKKAINSDNIISAPQVLNMLVDLAVNKPNLFKSLFSEEFLKNPEQPFNHEVIEQYFHGLNSALKKDIIGHIAYEKEGEKTSTLRKVIEDILEKINNGESDPTEIKSSIVSIIRKRKDVL